MRIARAAYARLYGPTTGDMVRLGDTTLLAEIERDHTHYGDELTTGATARVSAPPARPPMARSTW